YGAAGGLLGGARRGEPDGLRPGGRHALARLEVSLRRGREAGLDDVHAEALELASDHQLLLDVHRCAGGLLPVAQCRVEDPYPIHRGSPFSATGIPPIPASVLAPETRKPRATRSARGLALVGGVCPTPSRAPRAGS